MLNDNCTSKLIEDDPKLLLPKLEKGDSYRFHTMVKPVGSQCNLNCDYCFYLHKKELLEQKQIPRMSESMLELHIKQYIEAQTGDEVIFSWQGGEPTLHGLDFFIEIIRLQKKYKKENQRIENDLQTNGILIDDKWCEFLRDNNFLVGLSIDGPASMHDIFRQNNSGKPTFDRVMHTVNLLHKYKIPFNALCSVNSRNAKKPLDVYYFLRDVVKPRMIQFSPIAELKNFESCAPLHWKWDEALTHKELESKINTTDSIVTDWSIHFNDWGYFLVTIWDKWFKHDFGNVFIDQFENVISQMFGYGAQKCISGKICGKALAIEYTGDLYSCDHFVYPEYKLGNIRETHQGDLAFSAKQKQFAYAKSDSLPTACTTCLHLNLCWGGCPKNRFMKQDNGEIKLNYFCPSLKKFYSNILMYRSHLELKLGLNK